MFRGRTRQPERPPDEAHRTAPGRRLESGGTSARPNVAIIPIRQDSAVGPNAVRTFADQSVADVRRYWDARPCNIRHSPKPVGSTEYFDEVEARKYFVEPHIPGFAEFERWAGKRVLEVGCGIGTDSINFARAGAELTAVDLSSESLRIAEQRAERDGRRRPDPRSCRRTPRSSTSALAGEPFDLVYSFGVIHHTPHPDRALAQMRALAGARRHAEADGLPPPLVEGLLDPRRRRGAAGSGRRTSSSRSTPRRRPAAPSRSRTRGGRP